jgi:hypothetical protein
MGPGDGELVTRFLWIACDFPWDSMRLFNGFDGSENFFFFFWRFTTAGNIPKYYIEKCSKRPLK